MEDRVGWFRLRDAGLNFTGSEEVEAIASCVGGGVAADSARMPSCFEAQRILALQRQSERARENRFRDEQIRAMRAPVQVAPRTCIQNGGVTNCF